MHENVVFSLKDKHEVESILQFNKNEPSLNIAYYYFLFSLWIITEGCEVCVITQPKKVKGEEQQSTKPLTFTLKLNNCP